MEILLDFLSFSKRKVFKKSKIAKIYYCDPQSAGINLQSPQSDSTPWTLTLVTLLKLHGSSLSYRYFKVTDGSPMVPIQKHSLISCDNLALLGTLPKRELYINHKRLSLGTVQVKVAEVV